MPVSSHVFAQKMTRMPMAQPKTICWAVGNFVLTTLGRVCSDPVDVEASDMASTGLSEGGDSESCFGWFFWTACVDRFF